jgi:hypothetical protein
MSMQMQRGWLKVDGSLVLRWTPRVTPGLHGADNDDGVGGGDDGESI